MDGILFPLSQTQAEEEQGGPRRRQVPEGTCQARNQHWMVARKNQPRVLQASGMGEPRSPWAPWDLSQFCCHRTQRGAGDEMAWLRPPESQVSLADSS